MRIDAERGEDLPIVHVQGEKPDGPTVGAWSEERPSEDRGAGARRPPSTRAVVLVASREQREEEEHVNRRRASIERS